MNPPSRDFDRLCIHSVTTRPLAIEEAVQKYSAAHVSGITVWRDTLAGRNPRKIGQLIRDSGLAVVSLCRGGFLTGFTAESRAQAIDDNRRCIDEAAELGAPMVVMVCGATPGLPLSESRRQISEGLNAILPHAAAAGVRLAIEPLHPMYADSRSAINTISQARRTCNQLQSPWLGIAIDAYHTWWSEDLEADISHCAKEGRLFAFHISDWLTPTAELLNDRGLMGEGCIPLRSICSWVKAAGFEGFHEVEIFSNRFWSTDQEQYIERIKTAYLGIL